MWGKFSLKFKVNSSRCGLEDRERKDSKLSDIKNKLKYSNSGKLKKISTIPKSTKQICSSTIDFFDKHFRDISWETAQSVNKLRKIIWQSRKNSIQNQAQVMRKGTQQELSSVSHTNFLATPQPFPRPRLHIFFQAFCLLLS
jgi:hypothetical protein